MCCPRKLKVSVTGTFASYFGIFESDLTQLLYQLTRYHTLLRINICLNYNSSFFNLQISEKSHKKKKILKNHRMTEPKAILSK